MGGWGCGVYAKKMVIEVWVAESPQPGWGWRRGFREGGA